MDAPRDLRHDVPLASRCTFELGGAARFFVEATDGQTVAHARAWARERGLATAVLGGGSNVVIADDGFDGLVIAMATRGITHTGTGDPVGVTVAAGEPWSAFVDTAVARSWAGVECLAGIPGSTGATPIQNVGAYGQEVAETITHVRVLDASGVERDVARDALGFAYRDSAFKRCANGLADAIVLSVGFALRPGGAPAVRYPELTRALGTSAPTLTQVRDTVVALRRAKSMVLDASDENRRSAGSFFTNPVVSCAEADRVVALACERGLARSADDVPRYDAGAGEAKLAAGWLIERAGFTRGERRGAVGLSSRHALSLVHHGGGRARDLVAFAREIQDRVDAVFGLSLRIEPVLLGRFDAV